jgi:hypothetical protein
LFPNEIITLLFSFSLYSSPSSLSLSLSIIFLAVIGFELRVSCFLGRCFTAWAGFQSMIIFLIFMLTRNLGQKGQPGKAPFPLWTEVDFLLCLGEWSRTHWCSLGLTLWNRVHTYIHAYILQVAPHLLCFISYDYLMACLSS